MPKLLIFDAFTLLIRKKNVAIHVLLRCKIFSLKIWLCKIFDKFHVWILVALSIFIFNSEYIFLKNKEKIDRIYIHTNSSEKVHIIVYFSFIKECC